MSKKGNSKGIGLEPYVMAPEEAMAFLDSKGINYEVCDTPVPLLGNKVICGTPQGIGDEMIEGYYYLPKSKLGNYPIVDWPAYGDSMVDSDIEEGNVLRVEIGAIPHDGNIVVASIDNEYTTKVFFTDGNGDRWLIPRNSRYDCMKLSQFTDVRIVGVVIDIIKKAPHISFRECKAMVDATLSRRRQKGDLWECVMKAVSEGSHLFWAGSSWAVVYCVLRDCYNYEENVSEFERRAENLTLPMGFKHECTSGKVQRTISNHPYMRLHVDKWRENGGSVREIVLAGFLKNTLKDLPM